MFDWMNGGTPLDLLTPLAEGMKQGTAMAEQQERVRSDAANEKHMSDMLGLESKKEDFTESMWNSQADMRAAQLTLTQDQGKEAAAQLGNVADDNSTMVQAKSDLADALASGDPDRLRNLTPYTFRTPEASKAWAQTLDQAHQTVLGQAAANDTFADNLLKTSAIKTQTEQKNAVANLPGVDPMSFYDTDPKTGAKIWNGGKAAQAINDFAHSEDVFKSKNAASVYSAYARGSSAETVANIRATASTANAGLRASTGNYKTDVDNITKALSSGQITEQQADAQIDSARQRRDNPTQSGQPSGAGPSSAAPINAAAGVHALFGRAVPAAASQATPPAAPANSASPLASNIFEPPASIQPPPATLPSIFNPVPVNDPWSTVNPPNP